MRLTILNFHGVGPVTREVDRGERDCWLETDFFERVLDLVVGKPHVRLTVDDGNESDHSHVLPALTKRGLQASFFVCSERLDQPTFLSRSQVIELKLAGMTIGSHGAIHQPWRGLGDGELDREIFESRRILESLCSTVVDSAACPFGSYDRKVLSKLKSARYRAVYTSDGGSAHESEWLQARTTITRGMSMPAIERLVLSGRGTRSQLGINLRKIVKRLR